MIDYTKLIYFDIETVGEYKSFEDFKMIDETGSNSFKIKYERAQKRANKQWSGTIDEAYLNNAPLLPEYGKIVCISYGVFIKGNFSIRSKSIVDFENERGLIEFIGKLFKRADEKHIYLCGHNIKEFDLPFIFKKMLKYLLKVPNSINVVGKKPWEVNIYDTNELTKGTSFVSSSLADMTYLLGLDTPKDDINGSDVHSVFWDNYEIERIVTYCEKDVKAIRNIMERLNICLGVTL